MRMNEISWQRKVYMNHSANVVPAGKPYKKQMLQGLTAKQRKARYTEDHEGQAVKERVDEYLMKKTDKAIDMVKYAIKRGVRFDYLLVDSWFTNTKLVRFISSRHIKCHLLGMIKLGKTNYATKHGKMNAKQIIKHLQQVHEEWIVYLFTRNL